MTDSPAQSQLVQGAKTAPRLDVAALRRLAQVEEHASGGVLMASIGGETTWVNDTFVELSGHSLESSLGRSLSELLAGDCLEPLRRTQLESAIAERRLIRLETKLRSVRGREYWADVELQPLFDEAGAFAGTLAVVADVSEAVQLRLAAANTDERLRLALTGAGIGTWDWNVLTGEVLFDERWCAMLGYRIDEIEPHVSAWESLVHPDDLPIAEALLKEHFAGRSEYYVCDHRLRTKAGGWAWIHDAGRVLERDADGAPLRMSGVHIDITEAKAAEERARFDFKVEGAIRRIQQRFIGAASSNSVFECVLDEVLALSGSQCGFVGEADHGEDGTAYLRTHAIRGFTWDAASNRLIETGPQRRPVFTDMQTLVDNALRANAAVCPVDAASKRATVLIQPLFCRGATVGVVGLADIDRGFDCAESQRLQPLLSAIGQIIDVWREGQARAIAERKLRDSEERHRSIVDTALDAVITMDAEGRISAWNTQAERIFGWRADEVLGASLADTIIPAAMRESHRLGLANYIEHRVGPLLNTRLETSAIRRGGVEFPVELTIAPVRSGGFLSFTAFLRDITERKNSQAELRRHRQHLQDLVDEQTRDLLAAKERAERADRAKGEFLANVSHELRTPLHAILSFAKRGSKQSAAAEEPKFAHYFETIHTSGSRLLTLLNDLLDLSKLDAGQMRFVFGQYDLRAIAEAATSEFQAMAAERSVALASRYSVVDGLVRCDDTRMHQVVCNLLSNAIKFSPVGSTVRVVVEDDALALADGSSAPAIALRVLDEGVGVPAQERDAVFEKFVQSSRTRSGAGGTGLGLPICREIVSAHGGTISISDRAEGGSVFSIVLPRNPPPTNGDELPAQPPDSTEPTP